VPPFGDPGFIAEEVVVGPDDEVSDPRRDRSRAAWARVVLGRIAGRDLTNAPIAVGRGFKTSETRENSLEVEVLALVVRALAPSSRPAGGGRRTP
jgi:hypothetical protein